MFRKLLKKLMGAEQRPKPKKSAKKPKPASLKKKRKPQPTDSIGEVIAFFRIPVVAVIKITKGSLKTGDAIWIKGHTTDLKQTIGSMQVDHRPIQRVKKGEEFGLKISARVRRGDRVYSLKS